MGFSRAVVLVLLRNAPPAGQVVPGRRHRPAHARPRTCWKGPARGPCVVGAI